MEQHIKLHKWKRFKENQKVSQWSYGAKVQHSTDNGKRISEACGKNINHDTNWKYI